MESSNTFYYGGIENCIVHISKTDNFVQTAIHMLRVHGVTNHRAAGSMLYFAKSQVWAILFTAKYLLSQLIVN